MRYPFVHCVTVILWTICCSSIFSVTNYRRDQFRVSCCWPYGLGVHLQLLSSPDPMTRGHCKTFFSYLCFSSDWKNKMAALASDCPRHSELHLQNRWTEFNETLRKARSKRLLPSLCFSGWSKKKKQDGRLGLWLDEISSASSLKPLNGINETIQKTRSQRPPPSLCFSSRLEKQDGHPGIWLAEAFSTSHLKPPKRI